MADASHLERMGRELKCPICLSLLNSAVSLTCNHVFCNSCIEKSMKSASSCPVCKVPYRRREIRSAPHMDNLVSVYKSMEVASGVNIFVTQTAATKLSGEDNQTEDGMYEVQHNGHTKEEAKDCRNRKQHQRKGPKSTPVTSQRSSGSNLVKPSFPTKKRVQLPRYTTSGTEMEHKVLEARSGEIDRNESKNSTVSQKEMPIQCKQGEPIFTPFFWLREEEDLEKVSQQTDDNQIMYTPPEVPSFSDIKDSDDEAHCQTTPERGTRIVSNNADFVDSEMFDWTQRPCSPELCSSPQALQIEHIAEENAIPEKAEAGVTETMGVRSNNREGRVKRKDKTSDNKGGTSTSKKVSVAKEPRKNKRTNKTCEVTAVVQEGNKDSPLNFKRTSIKGKKVPSDAASVEEKNVPTLCDATEHLANNSNPTIAQIIDSEDVGKSSEGGRNLKKSGKSNKRAKKALAQSQKFGSEIITQRTETEKGCSSTEQRNKGLISQSHTDLSPSCNEKEVLVRCNKRTYKEHREKMPNSLKKVKFSIEGMSKDNDEDKRMDQSFDDIQRARDQLEPALPGKDDKLISSPDDYDLLKCNRSSTIRCAFCQSFEESEASGIMVHYLNGKLVADDHDARKNAIHVHKSCAEWAPNVYFEGDNIVNLDTELSRSRRIRCCCCGIKGAALGCYEKSCRKSFHVPCARLTPECRWDSDNFVILCPIHSSSQLPNEVPQSRKKRKSSAERKPCTLQNQLKTTEECKSHSDMQWKSPKKMKNLVLCCSALTNAEKEIVAKFENLSGVTILKNWKQMVTHVIASTDENGACRRTLKFLMGILEGKWILSVQWIKACIEAGDLVDEQQYAISVDIHGIRDGPKLGRFRLLNKQPKLFDGHTFYFMGDFTPSYKGYLHDLVVAAGGKVLNRKPVVEEHSTPLNKCSAKTVIIYSIELPEQCRPSEGNSVLNHRRRQAEALATSAGAVVATNSWIMNSIAGYKLPRIGE
ncbi:hypothetical protein ACS0TY_031684 [Phlomoides rotata]